MVVAVVMALHPVAVLVRLLVMVDIVGATALLFPAEDTHPLPVVVVAAALPTLDLVAVMNLRLPTVAVIVSAHLPRAAEIRITPARRVIVLLRLVGRLPWTTILPLLLAALVATMPLLAITLLATVGTRIKDTTHALAADDMTIVTVAIAAPLRVAGLRLPSVLLRPLGLTMTMIAAGISHPAMINIHQNALPGRLLGRMF